MTRIFVSYSQRDGAADRLIALLAERGYEDVYAYAVAGHGTTLGVRWEPSLLDEARICDVLVVLTGPESIASQRCTQEITVAQQRPQPPRTFEFVVQEDRGNDLLADRQRLVVSERADRFEAVVEALVPALAAAGFEPSPRRPRIDSPYPGLAAFGVERAEFFHGRDKVVEKIVERLDRSSLGGGVMSVIGPSGVGKSSIVRAGLATRLRTGRDLANSWFVADPFTPGENPLGALAVRLAETATAIGSASPLAADPGGIETGLRSSVDPGPLLSDLLSGHRHRRLLLVMDQAEELLSRSDHDDVARLATVLGRIVTDRLAWLIYTLRTEFVDSLLEEAATGLLVDDTVLVPALQRDELIDAIVRPAERLGWAYHPAAVAAMIDDTGDGGSLPLLAYALDRLFRRVTAQDRPNRLITLDDYTASGRVQDVLNQQAEAAFRDATVRAAEHLTDRDGDVRLVAERQVFRMLRRLVSMRDGTPVRRAVLLAGMTGVEIDVLEPFVAQRVVSLTDRGAAEVTHEALLSRWPRLRAELDELREALQSRADIERRTAEWIAARELSAPGSADDLLLPVTLLLPFLDLVRRGTDLEPGVSPSASGWAALRAGLAGLDLGQAEIDYVDRSLRAVLGDEVARISRDVVADPVRATGELLGRQSDLQRSLMTALAGASDTERLVELVHRTMAANPVHLLVAAHANGAWGVAWAPDGTRFATGGRDQAVRVWHLADRATGAALDMRHGRDAVARAAVPGWVRSVAWTSDGRYILSVGTDEVLRIWDAEGGDEIRAHLHSDRLWTVQSPAVGGVAVTAGADGKVRIWPVDRRSLEPRVVLDIGGGRLWAAALSPDGAQVAAACEDGYAYVVQVAAPERDRLRLPHPDKVRAITWSPDGRLIGTGCQDTVGRVFDARTGELLHELTGHGDQIRAIRWSPGGLRIATGSADSEIRLWDAGSGRSLSRLRQHDQGVCALDWSPAGDTLLTAADDDTVRLWKVGSEPVACVRLGQPARAIAWNRGIGRIAVALAENARTGPSEVVLLAPDGTMERDPAGQHPMPVRSVHWSAAGELITGSVDQTAVRWRDGQPEVTYAGARDAVVAAVPSPDAVLLLGASRDRIIRLWDADGTLQVDGEPEWHQSFLADADWDATGARFAVVSDDHRLSVHLLADRNHTMTDAGVGLTSVAWNPVTGQIAVGGIDGVILVYQCGGGIRPELERVLRFHSEPVSDLAWSPDGDLLCAAAGSLASVWDVHSGAVRTLLVGHAAAVTGCVWTAERAIATCGEDATVRLWSVGDADTRPAAGLPTADGIDPDSPDYLPRILDELGRRAGRPTTG
jgi:WD40 repeat protein